MIRHTVPTENNDPLGLVERLFRWPGLIFDTVKSKLVGVGFAMVSGQELVSQLIPGTTDAEGWLLIFYPLVLIGSQFACQ